MNKWLSKQPVVPIHRMRTYVTTPTFDVAATWKGYSEIVVSFNCVSPNRFVLRELTGLPTSPNYVLCIAFSVDGDDGNVTRYKLWEGVGEIIYDTAIPLYDGQVIEKNFRWEVWNCEDETDAIETTAVNLDTSVLRDVDSTEGDDAALLTNGTEITDFQSAANPGALTGYSKLFNQAGISNPATVQWTDVGNTITIGNGGVLTGDTIRFFGVNASGNFAVGDSVNQYYFTFRLNVINQTGDLFWLATPSNSTKIRVVNDTITIQHLGGTYTSSALTEDKWYVLYVDYGTLTRTGVMIIYDPTTLAVVYTTPFFVRVASDYQTWDFLQVGNSSLADVAMKSTIVGFTDNTDATVHANVLTYMANLIEQVFALPLTFPTDSSVPNN